MDLLARLAEPFPKEAIGWKPGKVAGNRCLALAYIDARDVMQRLDEVMGPENWTDQYTFLPDGTVLCRLALRVGEDWIAKQDVGAESEQPDAGDRHKAAVSDALKRAAVKWGIGRYLYRLDSAWADYDPVKKQIVTPPPLPPWALPRARAAATPDLKLKVQTEDLLGKVAEQGTAALETAWKALSKEAKIAVQGPVWDRIKQFAASKDPKAEPTHAAAR